MNIYILFNYNNKLSYSCPQGFMAYYGYIEIFFADILGVDYSGLLVY